MTDWIGQVERVIADACAALDQLEYASSSDKLAEALSCVAVVNTSLERGESLDLAGDVIKRVREALAKFLEQLREAMKEIEAESWSITVGTRISVTVNFAIA